MTRCKARRLLAAVVTLLSLSVGAAVRLAAMPYEGGGGETETDGQTPPTGGGSGDDGSEAAAARVAAEAAFAALEVQFADPVDGLAELSSEAGRADEDLAEASDLTAPDGVARESGRSKEAVTALSGRYDVLNGQTARAAVEVSFMQPDRSTPTGGDPVLLATGALSMTEVDLSYLFHETPVRVERTYRSDRSIWSSFGAGWSFPYDSRIIRGGSLDARSLRRAADDAEALVEGLYAQSSNRVRSNMDRLSTLRDAVASKVDRAARLESEATALLAQCAPWSDLGPAAGELLGRIHKAREAYLSLSARLDEGVANLRVLEAPGGALSSFAAYRNECKRLSEEIAKLATLTEASQQLNRNTLHEGDPVSFRGSGVDTLILIDGLGEPHLYRLAAEATFGAGPSYLPVAQLEDGAPNFFPGGTACVPSRAHDDALTLGMDGSFVLRRADGTFYRYGANGLLREIEDRNENRISFGYDEAMRLIDVIDDYGRRLLIGRTGDRIASITDPLGRIVRYGYDAAGNLAEVVDPAGDRIAYRYENGRLAAIEKPDGSTLRYTYGTVGGSARVLATSDEEGNTEHFEYRQGATIHTNPSGVTTTHSFDDRLRETRVTHADGSFIERSYDARGDLATVADENGAVTEYECDDNGNRTRTVWPDGSQSSSRYNQYGRPERRIDEEGNAVAYQYDERGNLLRIEYPDGGSIRFSYDGAGDLTGIVDQRGNAVRLERDRYGHLARYIDPLGSSWKFAHDILGNITSRIDPDGVATRYGYTKDGRIAWLIDSEGGKVEYRYNQRKDLAARVDQNNAVTRFEFDRRHLPKRVVDPTGGTTEYRYRPDGRLDRATIGKVSTTDYVYDERAKVSRVTQVETGITLSYARDAAGRVTAVTDGRGYVTRYYRDARGRIVATENPDGGVRRSIYARTGRLVASIDELGNRTEWLLDALGRVVSLRDPVGGQESFAYDEAGNLVRRIDKNGGVTNATYDEANRLVGIVDPTGGATRYAYTPAGRLLERTDRRGSTTRYEYDRSGRLARVVGPLGETREYRYDRSGNLTAATDPNGNATEWEYDPLGRIVAEIDPAGSVLAFSYGPSGAMEKITDPCGGIWRYEFDAAGRLTAFANPLGQVWRSSYDPAGNLIASTDPVGTRVAYAYNPENRLASTVDGSGAKTEYRYDRAGNRIAEVDGLGLAYTYQYDASGKLIGEVNRSGVRKSYRYDPGGGLTSTTDFAGRTTRYERDALGRIVRIAYPDGSRRLYAYDAEGNLLQASNDRADLRFQFDASSRPVVVADEKSGETLRYSYDSAGNLLAILADDSTPLASFGYGSRSEVVDVSLPSIGNVAIDYDKAGREIMRRLPNGVDTRRWYDLAGRVIGIRASVGGTLDACWAEAYLYDPAGRRAYTIRDDGSFLTYRYDNAGRLAEIAYPYDDGSREVDLEELKRAGLIAPLASGSPASILSPRATTSGLQSAAMPDYASMDADAAAAIRELVDTVLPLRRFPPRPVEKAWIDFFLYDAAGNRIEKRNNFGSITYTYGADHELLSAGRTAYSYDANGNLIAEQSTSESRRFSYGPDNRVSGVDLSRGLKDAGDEKQRVASVRYGYDALGRRVERDAFSAAGSNLSRLRYFYDRFSFDPIRLRLDLSSPDRAVLPALTVPVPAPPAPAGASPPEGSAARAPSTTQAASAAPPSPASASTAPPSAAGARSDAPQHDARTQAGTPGASLRKAPTITGLRYRYPGAAAQSGAQEERSIAMPGPLDRTEPFHYPGGAGFPADRDSSATTTIARVYAAGRLIAAVRPVGAEYYTRDLLGSVALITDGRGRVVSKNTYDIFGLFTKRAFDPLCIPGYTGKDVDPEAAIYNLGYRDYDPSLARFTTPDPARRGANWYVYAENDPVNRLDPLGLDSFYATFSKDTNMMTAIYVSTTGTTINPEGTVTYSWPATNHVRNELNGERDRPDVGTIPLDGSESQAYFPREMPTGVHNLQRSVTIDNVTFVPTDATREVATYGRYDPQNLLEPDRLTGRFMSSGTQLDAGYNIEVGELNSLGCVHFPDAVDFAEFRSLSDRALASGGPSQIDVRGGKSE